MGSEEGVDKTPKVKKRKYVIEDVVVKTRKKIEPLLVDFANGQPLEGAELIGTLHRSADKRGLNSNHSILTVQTPNLSYAGSETSQQKQSGVTMFVGLLDKVTGRMRLVETSQHTVQPVIRKLASQATNKDTPENTTYDEKQEAIAAAFGSKKAKQAVTKKQQNKVEAETMSGAIDHAVTSAQSHSSAVNQYLEQQEETSLLCILPPCNRKASEIENVYQLEDLASEDFLAELQEPAKALLTGQQDLDPKSTLLFREMVENARHEGKFGKQLKLACVALLVNHLLAFLDCRDRMLRDFEKGRIMDNCCRAVASSIVQEYTQKQGNFITKTQRDEDRVLCFILILALISNKYELSVSTVLQSMPIKKDRLNLLMRVIGATYNSSTYSFVLRLPLAKYSLPKKPKRTRK